MEMKEPTLVIRLPKIRWGSILNGRVFLSALSIAFFCYWYAAIRPVIWIHGAKVEAFSSMLGSDAAGKIEESFFQEGDRVQKGETLFSLDCDLLKAQLKQCKAKVAVLNGQIQAEKLRMEKAMQKYLLASNELDFHADSADAIQKNLGVLEDAQMKSEMASSQLASLQLEEAILEAQLKRIKVEAPFDGVVLKKWKNKGEIVSSGENICSLFNPKQMWVGASLSEKYLGKSPKVIKIHNS